MFERIAVRAGSVTAAVLALLISPSAHAGSFRVVHSFAGGKSGGYPEAGVIRDRAGDLYGTTYYGGTANQGALFRLARNGSETVLHSFAGGKDGENPVGSLVRDRAGNLYGATAGGGAEGSGTIFRLAPDGTETILHAFSNGNDGGSPAGGLLLEGHTLYGAAAAGGAYGAGAVFGLTTKGSETVLFSFSGGSDGYEPVAGVIRDSAGNLYGTTYQGGANSLGTVYEIFPGGTETVLHSFAGGSDGAGPEGSLVFDAAGNLYGTTEQGGADDAGTVFRIAPDGTENVLYSFTGGNDGADPACGLVRDAAGNLYGTAPLSQADGDGTVFELQTDGTLAVLHAFSGADGTNPTAGLIADAKGNLYGTTPQGGAHGYGVVFRLKE
jgi:uncharacterized repeat protein (TIGR03803 family)